ncbi:hypothetical protein HU200_039896 [Digitaria exilis]|uniref:UDP-glycosyltransferases domain-containing protein n=1 Tax=Digitaria exilis TaxID=1010633 RepID=A0A835BA24_9POAL|nr:hypothetical protein HU200_039896 [Digitaria exilis]
MESFLRRRDLPRAIDPCVDGVLDPLLVTHAEGISHERAARAVILNTAASMEGPAISRIAPRVRDVFAIGPLHATSTRSAGTGSLWPEDDGCVAWLDGHADRSVVYVSLGSLAVMSHEEFTEFMSGLIAAGYPFLWVLRRDMVETPPTSSALSEAVEAAAEGDRARIVEWAPQQAVLRHRAVGCFLTHAGWNSTVEAAVEGVPMVCWPFFADQLINSRFVGAVWRTGVDMKDVCDRETVERTVREAMESGEIRDRAEAMARQLRMDVDEGGSSSSELRRLVRFINDLSAAK